MAKVKTLGASVVVVSDVKLEDIKKLKKYAPEALTLFGGEDGKEPMFCIDVTSGHGTLNSVGAEFGPVTSDGYATITLIRAEPVADIKAAIVDQYGTALANLNELEAQIPAALAEVERKHAAVMECIEIG